MEEKKTETDTGKLTKKIEQTDLNQCVKINLIVSSLPSPPTKSMQHSSGRKCIIHNFFPYCHARSNFVINQIFHTILMNFLGLRRNTIVTS